MTLARPSRKQSASAFGSLLKKTQLRIEPRLRRVLKKSEKESAHLGPDVAAMLHAIRSLCERGGKRLRPALALVGAACVTDDYDEKLLLEVGVSLELLQAYFLIHDDWMDDDAERRGGPTAHVELAAAFGSEALGARAAILAGDFAQALALGHLVAQPIAVKRLPAGLKCFADMQMSAVLGQQLDVISASDTDPELTYALKTASYTVEGPLCLGAALAGGPPSTLATLREFAKPAGIAFQIRDDLVGALGDPVVTGKPRGGDLTAGKNTWLIQHAVRQGSKKQKAAITQVLGKKRATAAQVHEALAALVETGAVRAAEDRIEALCEQANSTLERARLTPGGRLLLAGGLIALSERKA